MCPEGKQASILSVISVLFSGIHHGRQKLLAFQSCRTSHVYNMCQRMGSKECKIQVVDPNLYQKALHQTRLPQVRSVNDEAAVVKCHKHFLVFP